MDINKKSVKVAVGQMTCSLNRYHVNIKNALKTIEKAAVDKYHLICLPEAFSTSMDLVNIEYVSETIPGKTSKILCDCAKKNNIYIAAGLLEKSDHEYFSTAILINNRGEIMGKYRRANIFTLEKRYLNKGHDFEVYDTDLGRIGFIIGYDINYPETCRKLFMEKVDIIICLALIPDNFSYITSQLVIARAFENLCYFVFCSGIGDNQFAGFEYMGGSMIVGNPMYLDSEIFDFVYGDEVLSKANKDSCIIGAELNIERLKLMIENNSILLDIENN